MQDCNITEEGKLSLVFNTKMCVSGIENDGLAHFKGIRLGMRLVSFQGKRVQLNSECAFEDAMALLQRRAG